MDVKCSLITDYHFIEDMLRTKDGKGSCGLMCAFARLDDGYVTGSVQGFVVSVPFGCSRNRNFCEIPVRISPHQPPPGRFHAPSGMNMSAESSFA